MLPHIFRLYLYLSFVAIHTRHRHHCAHCSIVFLLGPARYPSHFSLPWKLVFSTEFPSQPNSLDSRCPHSLFPLILVGFDFDLCAAADYSMPRIEHLFWMSIFLPGLLAIVTSCAYMLSSKSKENLVSKPLHTSFSNHAAAYSIHKFEGNLPTYNEAIQARKDDMKLILDKFDCNRLNVNENISDSTIVISQLSENSNGCRDYALGHYSLQERDELLKTEDGNRTLQAEDISSKICWEKRSRFVAAFISCVCSMPCAVLALIFLSDNSENMWPKTTQIATGLESLYRLHVLRSLISPLLWINEYISI